MKQLFAKLALCLALLALPIQVQAANNAPAEQRAAIDKMRAETLTKLYALQPDAEREIKNAIGYAVFSSGELAVIWVSAGYGHGVAHDNRDNTDIYMQVAKAGLGIGAGAKDFNTVFVFHDPDAYHNFITTGLDLTGTADVAAKAGEKGAAASGAADAIPGVRIYQLTDTGLMAQAMLQGTKYWRDDALNAK